MIYIARVKQEGSYLLAEFPDALGCQTFAEDKFELWEMAKEALEGWLEAHLVDGDAPPRPKRRRRTIDSMQIEVNPALSVALQIRWARQEAGLSQQDLAGRIGVSQQQIAKLERPGSNPSMETLAKIGNALGVHVDVELRGRAKKVDSGIVLAPARSRKMTNETRGRMERTRRKSRLESTLARVHPAASITVVAPPAGPKSQPKRRTI